MKQYIKVQQPAREYDQCVGTTCDLCGAKSSTGDWSESWYDINETEVTVTVKAEKGKSYPEGGYKEVYDIDLCPMCFTSKLVPWLKTQGANIETREVDW